MEKVTAPDKIVTDKLVLEELKRQGIDKDYVEFWKDYGAKAFGKSPYSKKYRDLKSGKKLLVASGLPICNVYGHRIESSWVQSNGIFHIQYNLFDAKVEGASVILVCLADQPDRTRLYDQVTYHPQLFLDGSKVKPISDTPTLLETDPVNGDYHNNILEWDYGICKRRIRVIEGMFREHWIFHTNPNGEVRIIHNQQGGFRLKLGEFKINNDVEVIPKEAFVNPVFGYPFEVGASLTVYPDAHIETATVDGQAYEWQGAGATWATMRTNPGTSAADTQDSNWVGFRYLGAGDLWNYLARLIILFDISAVTASGKVLTGTLSLYGDVKIDDNSATPDLNIYSSAPASNLVVAAGDYDSLGSDAYSTTITYAGFNVGTPGTANDFVFNADPGIIALQAAVDGDGIVKLGGRDVTHDVDGATPNNGAANAYSYLKPWMADKGTTYRPKLVVTYSELHDLWRTRIGGVTYGVNLTEIT